MNFESIYIEYFARMKRFAKNYISSEEDAENIVQDIFTVLWERKIDFNKQPNVTGYLLTIVKNRSLDYIKHKKIESKYKIESTLNITVLDDMSTILDDDSEIMQSIKRSIDKLPAKCQEIFIKSKIEGKKNKEIAHELNISINTVENQMGIALKKLRADFKGDLILVLIVLEFIYKI